MPRLWRYGSDWFFAEGGPPGELYDLTTGSTVRPAIVDEATGTPIMRETIRIRARTDD